MTSLKGDRWWVLISGYDGVGFWRLRGNNKLDHGWVWDGMGSCLPLPI